MSVSIDSCLICYTSYDLSFHLPRNIPSCSHTFCSTCLINILKKNESEIKCPLCRGVFITSKNSIDTFPVNYTARELVEIKAKQRICSEHSKPLVYYCLNEQKVICCECGLFGGCHGHEVQPLKDEKDCCEKFASKLIHIGKEINNFYTNTLVNLQVQQAKMSETLKLAFCKIFHRLSAKEKELDLQIKSYYQRLKEELTHEFGPNSKISKGLQQEIQNCHDLKGFEGGKELADFVANFQASTFEDHAANYEIKNQTHQDQLSSNLQLLQNRLQEQMSPAFLIPSASIKDSKRDIPNEIILRFDDKNLMFNGDKDFELDILYQEAWKHCKKVSIFWNKASCVRQDTIQLLFWITQKLKCLEILELYSLAEEDVSDFSVMSLISVFYGELGTLQNLKIDLQCSNLSSQALKIVSNCISGAIQLKKLTLEIGINPIDDQSVESLVSSISPLMASLESFKINLTLTNCTEKALNSLSVLNMQELQHFSISFCKVEISGAVLKNFAKNCLCKLRKLKSFVGKFLYTLVDDDSVMKLLECLIQVDHLSLNTIGSQVTQRCWEHFQKNIFPAMNNLMSFDIKFSDEKSSLEVQKTILKIDETLKQRRIKKEKEVQKLKIQGCNSKPVSAQICQDM